MTSLAKFLIWINREGFVRRLHCAIFAMLPILTFASFSTTLNWNPSSDPHVTGYNIYYGTESHHYTNKVAVGNVTTATIKNLTPGTTYFFAAKSQVDSGDESDFSNEAAFAGYKIKPCSFLQLETMPPSMTNDQVIFSLAAGAPAAVSINPTNGLLSWNTDLADANTINSITIIITDLTNPNASTQTTLSVKVSDYFDLALASVPVQTGQTTNLPITLISSDGATNMTFSIAWPGDRLLNPSLTLNAPITGGTLQNQGTNLLIQIWTTDGSALMGTNQIGQLNFLAAPGQSSTFLNLPVSAVAAAKTDGSAFSTTFGEIGEVVVVGTNPLLRPHASDGQGRTVTIYANPGAAYQLQQATSLSPPVSWQPSQDYLPTNVLQNINLDSVNPIVFYRLMQE
jgi:Fibronectin type III domain